MATTRSNKLLPLPTQQVTADLRALGLKGARLTRRERRTGYQVRKHNRCVVSVDFADFGNDAAAGTWAAILDHLEARGYSFVLLSGERGAAAKAKALETGIVLVYRSA